MTTKEISIDGNRITVKKTVNSALTTVFSTDWQYMITDPNGQFKAGGYSSCPTFYGSTNSGNGVGISDKDNGWWPSDLLRGVFSYSRTTSVYLDCPKYDQAKVVYDYAPTNQVNRTYKSPTQPIKAYPSGTVIGSFNWVLSPCTYDLGGSQKLCIWPDNISVPGGYQGGQAVEFYWNPSPSWIDTWVCQWVTTDKYNNPTYNTTTVGSAETYIDGAGQKAYNEPAPWWRPTVLMYKTNPVTLSISVSP